MPSRAVAHQHRLGPWRDLDADLLEVEVHAFRVGRRRDDCSTNAAGWTDRAEDIYGVVTIVPHHRWARADRRPDIGVRALLSDPGFVLEPDFDRRVAASAKQSFLQAGTEVFLECLLRRGILLGGRGCSRVSFSLRSHLPIVRSGTSTEKRRATS